MALELSVFDSLPEGAPAFTRGFCAALIATTCCYPLDTLRCARICFCLQQTDRCAL